MADGTNNDADFAEQDRSEKNKEENEKLTAAIEQFDGDQEAINESSTKFDDDRKNVDDLEAEETKKKMTGMLNESKTGDDDLFQSSSDDISDRDLENSENAEDYVKEDLKKKSLQENQGTITKAEFKDQECSDRVEAEIPAKISELSPLVQGIDQKMSNSKRLARELEEKQEELKKILGLTGDAEKEDSQTKIAVLEKELYKLTRERESAAIEQFDRDQEAINESSTEFDGDRKNVDDLEAEETKKKVTGMLNESKTGDDDLFRSSDDDLKNKMKELGRAYSFLFDSESRLAESSQNRIEEAINQKTKAWTYAYNFLCHELKKIFLQENQGLSVSPIYTHTSSENSAKISEHTPLAQSNVIRSDFRTKIQELELNRLIEIQTQATKPINSVIRKFVDLQIQHAELNQSVEDLKNVFDPEKIALTGDTKPVDPRQIRIKENIEEAVDSLGLLEVELPMLREMLLKMQQSVFDLGKVLEQQSDEGVVLGYSFISDVL